MKQQKKSSKQSIDVVASDRNWISRVNNEHQSQHKWEGNWGFLSNGFSPEKTGMKPSIDNKIKQLEKEIDQIDSNTYSLTSQTYGKGKRVQLFDNTKYNMQQNKDLRALQRRLPKGWKKQKWTPPVDPYDPLSKITKKKQ